MHWVQLHWILHEVGPIKKNYFYNSNVIGHFFFFEFFFFLVQVHLDLLAPVRNWHLRLCPPSKETL